MALERPATPGRVLRKARSRESVRTGASRGSFGVARRQSTTAQELLIRQHPEPFVFMTEFQGSNVFSDSP